MNSVWCVFGCDEQDYFLAKIFTTELLARNYADDSNRCSSYYNYVVRERRVYDCITDEMRVPNDFGEDE